MPAPLTVTPYVRRFVNPVLIHLAGHGWFADLEHVGRRTGTVRHTPLLVVGERPWPGAWPQDGAHGIPGGPPGAGPVGGAGSGA